MRYAILLAALFTFLSSHPARAQQKPLSQLESDFRTLPPDARRHTGPLFWLHGDESKARLEMYLEKVVEGGNGSFTAESRPHNDWLGPNWYRDLDICLQAAKKNNLKMWIFDEKWWPSGEVGGKVPPQYGSKRLIATSTTAQGPTRIEEGGYTGENFLSVVAGKQTPAGIDPATLVDLSHYVKDGVLSWNVPAGDWQIMKFSWQHDKSRRILVDGASQDCVDWYIKTVYQPHYDHFPQDFGRTIVGYFYDEPETPGDWGTELPKVLAERQVDWKKAYVAWKFKLAGEDQAAARYQYQDAFAEAWGRTLYGGLQKWCSDHHVISMGHFLEHGNDYLRMEYCAGNMFQLQKYSDMGAIDAVYRQFVMGKRLTSDSPIWQTPKIASSISHVYGKTDDIAMVEIFGARGQDLTYPEMKWWADHMQVSGVNFLIPHSFNPKSPHDTDCPPYFYNGGFEPRWPLYRVFADYTSRLSLMLSGGRHVCPVAQLYLGGSFHVGKSITPDGMSEALQDALYDSDWLPYDVFENNTGIIGNELVLHQEHYRALIVPATQVIPYATAAKIRAFFDAGGIVIAYGILPSQSATLGKTAQDITALLGDPNLTPSLQPQKTTPTGGRFYFLSAKPTPEDLQKVLSDSGVIPVAQVKEGQTDHWLHALHRVKSGHDIYFLANQIHTGQARHFQLQFTAPGTPECWDPMRNTITSIPFTRQGDVVTIDLTLEPLESLLLVFQSEARALPARIEGTLTANLIPITRDPSPPAPTPQITTGPTPDQLFKGLSWFWTDEPQPVPPSTRYFRKSFDIPANRKLTSAPFTLTADNQFQLFVNGQSLEKSPGGDDFRIPSQIDLLPHLKPGQNILAIAATNQGAAPNPAGLIGKLNITFDQGDASVIPIDATWKCSKEGAQGWELANFNDNSWLAAKPVAPYGAAPWHRLSDGITRSPIPAATPFAGHFILPGTVNLSHSRLYLQLDTVTPEPAARVTLNGQDIGGVIGQPMRLDITTHVKPGPNTLRIEPFAPKSATIAIIPQP